MSDPKFESIPLSTLHFDTKNPRFPKSLDGTSESSILKFMLEDAGLIDLMRSIAKQGFFPGEPLLVSPDQTASPLETIDTKEGAPETASNDTPEQLHYRVIEGNRRLAACKLLNNPESAPARKGAVRQVVASMTAPPPTAIPCLKFPSQAEIIKHLGYRHVTGIKEWEPLSKARFLQTYFETQTGDIDDRLRDTARSIGSRADYVGRLLTALGLYENLEDGDFYGIEGLSDSAINFSLISSTLAYSNIVSYLGLESAKDLKMSGLIEDNWKFLARYIFEVVNDQRTRLGESRNIRLLADVLGDEDARGELELLTSPLERIHRKYQGGDFFRATLHELEESIHAVADGLRSTNVSQDDILRLEEIQAQLESIITSVTVRAVEER